MIHLSNSCLLRVTSSFSYERLSRLSDHSSALIVACTAINPFTHHSFRHSRVHLGDCYGAEASLLILDLYSFKMSQKCPPSRAETGCPAILNLLLTGYARRNRDETLRRVGALQFVREKLGPKPPRQLPKHTSTASGGVLFVCVYSMFLIL